MEALKIESFAAPKYQKCECCDRVRDTFFQLRVYDAKTAKMVVGSFTLCKECGQNFGDILGMKTSTSAVVEDFIFE